MSNGCPSLNDLIRWLAGETSGREADTMRTHVHSCAYCRRLLSNAAPAGLIAQVAASEHIDSITLSEYADGALSGARRQLVKSHLDQCLECDTRLTRLLEGRSVPRTAPASNVGWHRNAPTARILVWWRDSAAVLAVALAVVGVWWFLNRGYLLGTDGVVAVHLPLELLRELPADKRAVMGQLCGDLARTTPVVGSSQDVRYRGADPNPAPPRIQIIYPLPGDKLPTLDLIVLVRTPGDSAATVEAVEKATGATVGRWTVPSGQPTRLPEKLAYGHTYSIVAHVVNDPSLRSEDRLFSTATESLAEHVQRLSERCHGDILLLGALYETYGMYGAADRYYAAAADVSDANTRGTDVYQAWRLRSGLEGSR
ncbi:MAG: hypothetical protein AMXMBFR61_05700 [Fimbriimonadales bacterium]